MVKKSARRSRRTHCPAFKARVDPADLREDKTMTQWCQEFEVRAARMFDRKRKLLEGASNVFAGPTQSPPVGLAHCTRRSVN